MKNLILALSAFSQLGGFVSLNFPCFLNLQILQEFEVDQLTFNLLFTVVSLPNIVVPFIIGYLTKFIKPRTAFLIMICLVFFGQMICTYSIYKKQFAYFILGRFFMGFGHVNSNQPKNLLVNKLFQKQSGFAFSLFPAIGRLGVFSSAIYFAQFSNIDSSLLIRPALLVNAITLFSLACVIVAYKLDKDLDKEQYLLQQQQNNQISSLQSLDSSNISDHTSESLSRKVSEENQKLQEKLNNKNIIKIFKEELNIQYWLIAIFSALGMVLYYPLINNIQLIFKEQYHIQGPYIVYLQIIPSIMSSVLGVFLGQLLDKVGKRASFCIICGFFAVVTFTMNILLKAEFLIQYSRICTLSYMISLGAFWSLYSILELPCTNIVIKPQYIGFASGISLSMQNSIISISGLVMGSLVNPNYYYSHPFLTYNGLYFILSIIFFAVMYGLYITDIISFGGRLQNKYQQQQPEKIINNNNKQPSIGDIKIIPFSVDIKSAATTTSILK